MLLNEQYSGWNKKKSIVLTSACNCKNISLCNSRNQPATISISNTDYLFAAGKHWALDLSRSSIQQVITHQKQNALEKPGTGIFLKALLLAKADRPGRSMRMEVVWDRSYPSVISGQVAPTNFWLKFTNCSVFMKMQSRFPACEQVSLDAQREEKKKGMFSLSMDIHIRMRRIMVFPFGNDT